jgi:hypothetical protein
MLDAAIFTTGGQCAMKLLSSKRLIIIGAALVVVVSAVAWAASSPDAPLPLPDVIFYGTTTRDGEPITEGTVKAVLPRGGIVSAAIGEIAGTDYSYALVVPLGMYDPDNGVYEADSARLGEAINFYVDDLPAMFEDENGMAASEFVIPQDGVGETYVVDLILTGPSGYPLGDVNANGRRDSADALLVLKYDIGLMNGGESFPPGPGQIYLPLCDIVGDGQCNSSDALRILQCDVGMPGVDCPSVPSVGVTALRLSAPTEDGLASHATEGATLVLRTEVEGGPQPDTITVRVVADDPLAELGAVSLELRYDAALLSPEACIENPSGLLDAAACNPAFAPGVVRFNAVSTAGAGEEATLAEITFRVLDPAAIEDPAGALTLAPDGVFDIEGGDLDWCLEMTWQGQGVTK